MQARHDGPRQSLLPLLFRCCPVGLGNVCGSSSSLLVCDAVQSECRWQRGRPWKPRGAKTGTRIAGDAVQRVLPSHASTGRADHRARIRHKASFFPCLWRAQDRWTGRRVWGVLHPWVKVCRLVTTAPGNCCCSVWLGNVCSTSSSLSVCDAVQSECRWQRGRPWKPRGAETGTRIAGDAVQRVSPGQVSTGRADHRARIRLDARFFPCPWPAQDRWAGRRVWGVLPLWVNICSRVGSAAPLDEYLRARHAGPRQSLLPRLVGECV